MVGFYALLFRISLICFLFTARSWGMLMTARLLCRAAVRRNHNGHLLHGSHCIPEAMQHREPTHRVTP